MNLRQEIEHFTPALRRLAQGLAGVRAQPSGDGCDEWVQETLLRAIRFEKPVKGIAIQHWLYAILVGVIRQSSRNQIASEVAGTGAARQISSGNRTPLQRSDAGNRPAGDRNVHRLASPDIRLPLQALALEEREVLALVVLEGMNYTSAAAILGLPRPTLVARLARARGNLAQQNAPANLEKPGHLRLIK